MNSTGTNLDVTRGERLRELRQQKGLTMDELGQEIDLTKGFISRIEKGDSFSPQTLNALAEYYGVTKGYILDGDKKQGSKANVSFANLSEIELLNLINTKDSDIIDELKLRVNQMIGEIRDLKDKYIESLEFIKTLK